MKLEQLLNLHERNEARELEFAGTCCDCGEPVQVISSVQDDGNLAVSGGAIKDFGEKFRPEDMTFKCDPCFGKNPLFGRRCEVYSRVSGYLRPTSQWNKGKQAEFAIRKPFKISAREEIPGVV